MKRQISILACVLMLLAIVFAVASCSQPEAAHVHEYAELVSKEATCTEKGEITLVCACGDKYINETAAKGHNLVTVAAVEPTCTTEGKTEGVKCSDCGLVTVAQSTIAPVGHKLGAAATCTTAQTCELCDHVFVEALGHKATAATCTEPSVCKACGEEQGPALGHDANEATCTEASICSVCDEELEPALGHQGESDCYTGWCIVCWDAMVYGNDNHTFYNECDGTCNKCWAFVNWDAGHQMVYHEATESTCTVYGNYEYWQCELCGGCWDNEYAMMAPQPAFLFALPELAPHEYFYPCDAHCMNCYELTNEEAAHSFTHVDAVAPTCTDNGNVEYDLCDLCGYAFGMNGEVLNRFTVIVPALGHDYTYECDEICKVCGEITREGAEHLLDYIEAVAPTCTKTGNIEHWTCEYCVKNFAADGRIITTSVVIPANGHDYTYECDPVCLVCFDVNPDAEHDIVHVAKQEPGCTTAGAKFDYWYCTYCDLCWVNEDLTANTNKANALIPATGHSGHDYDLKCDVCNYYVRPEAGVAFKLGFYQANSQKYFYITGTLSGNYGATIENKYQSPDFFIEEATGGFYIYFMNGTTKTYISVQVSGTYNNVKFTTTKGLFTFDEKTGAFMTKTSLGTVYLGTYNNYNTLSASYISYITGSNAANVDKTQFILRAEILVPHDCDCSEPTCTKASSACTVCGEVKAALGHTTEEGVCDRCGVTVQKSNSEKFDFSKLSGYSTTALSTSGLLDAFKTAAPSTAHALTSVTTADKIYKGNGSGGNWSNQGGMLKTGTGSAAGKMVLKFSKKVTKVVITCHTWTTSSSDTVKVNGSATQIPSQTGSYGTLTFTVSASDTITIDFNKRVFVQSIEFFYE